jgi:hypothetical protein
VVTWDIDRFEQLQDAAWELDARGDEQDARVKRVEAFSLLAHYWDLLRTKA